MVMPSVPYPETGAEQADRASGIRQLVRLGCEVRVIAKSVSWYTSADVQKAESALGVKIFPVPYRYSNTTLSVRQKAGKFLRKLANPLLLDGAALEYAEPNIQRVFKEQLEEWQPDIAWFEYTYLWPLYRRARQLKVKIVTRSINFEPHHFLQEDGYSFLNFLKVAPKYVSEYIAVRSSSWLFSITPRERKIYQRLGARNAEVLPLRSLESCMEWRLRRKDQDEEMDLFFMGSTYNVQHNRLALEFLLTKVMPLVHQKDPKIKLSIYGAKIPADLAKHCVGAICYKGYVEDLASSLKDMDIAVVPSLAGAGMQQKIFESLARGFPVIASRRGMGGYPFEDGRHLLYADTAADFADSVLRLKNDRELRFRLGEAAKDLSRRLFSAKALDDIIRKTLIA